MSNQSEEITFKPNIKQDLEPALAELIKARNDMDRETLKKIKSVLPDESVARMEEDWIQQIAGRKPVKFDMLKGKDRVDLPIETTDADKDADDYLYESKAEPEFDLVNALDNIEKLEKLATLCPTDKRSAFLKLKDLLNSTDSFTTGLVNALPALTAGQRCLVVDFMNSLPGDLEDRS